jgi:polyisoprenoid-binding protein YceI
VDVRRRNGYGQPRPWAGDRYAFSTRAAGRFDRYHAEISGDPATLAGASIRLEIDARTVNTANKMRDDYLRTADFFDVARYPKITFISSQVRREGDQVVVKGILEMHGATKEIEIPFTSAEGRKGADMATWSYRGHPSLDRLAFDLGADSVAAKISLKREVELDLLLVGFFQEPTKAAGKTQAR